VKGNLHVDNTGSNAAVGAVFGVPFKPVALWTKPGESPVTIPRQSAATLLSHTYDADLFVHANRSRAPLTVDRTSLWSAAGWARSSGYGPDARHQITCDTLVLDDLFDITKLSDDTAVLISETMRFCFTHYLAAYLQFRCTPYGVAKSGICLSTYLLIVDACIDLDQNIVRAVNNNPFGPTIDRLSQWLVDIVEDRTAYCVSTEDLRASYEALHLAGLDRKVTQTQSAE